MTLNSPSLYFSFFVFFKASQQKWSRLHIVLPLDVVVLRRASCSNDPRPNQQNNRTAAPVSRMWNLKFL